MTVEDEILLEQYFPYKNLTLKERTYCINLLLNSKELNESEVGVGEHYNPRFDLVFLSLDRKNDIILFDGAIANNEENRMMYGEILKRGSKIVMMNTIYRLSDMYDENKEFTIIEGYSFKDGHITRSTLYEDKAYFESELDPDTFNKAESFLDEKAKSLRLKK